MSRVRPQPRTYLSVQEVVSKAQDYYRETAGIVSWKRPPPPYELLEVCNKRIYQDRDLQSKSTPEEIQKLLIVIQELFPEEFQSTLNGMISAIEFSLRDVNLQETVGEKVIRIIETKALPAKERLRLLYSLRKYNLYEIAYPGYRDVVEDTSIPMEFRIDALIMMYSYQRDEEYIQETVIEFSSPEGYYFDGGKRDEEGIDTLLSERRLLIIESFFDPLRPLFGEPIYGLYSEEFIAGCFSAFFYNPKNQTREIIRSGGALLQLGCISLDEKKQIARVLLDIASDPRHDENTRGDAADFIKTVCDPENFSEFIERVDIILREEIGFANIGKGNTYLENQRTFYNNSQNVHYKEIDESIEGYISKKKNVQKETCEYVLGEVMRLIDTKWPVTKERAASTRAKRALHRIKTDQTPFSSRKFTLLQILTVVYTDIEKSPSEEIPLLQDLLVDELHEMGDTCSSGHAARIINVLCASSSEEAPIKISFSTQIIGNVSAFINRLIQEEEEDVQEALTTVFLPDASPEIIEQAKDWRDEHFPDIYETLFQEFVGQGFATKNEFDEAYNEAVKVWAFGEEE